MAGRGLFRGVGGQGRGGASFQSLHVCVSLKTVSTRLSVHLPWSSLDGMFDKNGKPHPHLLPHGVGPHILQP